MEFFDRTDLACESAVSNRITDPGINIESFLLHGCEIVKATISTSEAEKETKRKIGKYYTICCGSSWKATKSYQDNVSIIISCLLQSLLPSETKRILIVGLGNKFVTSDALGPLTIDRLIPTHPIDNNAKTSAKLSLISPGVSGQTGIESYEHIKAIVDYKNIDCAITIDSLCARSTDRLSTIIQISNTGIQPGSGVGNHKKEISYDTLGIPVISIGVPLVVSSSTLVLNTLKEAGISSGSDKLMSILSNGTNFFVTQKECDLIVEQMSNIISNGIQLTFKN